ncbi:unnamed protein product [Malus baccata var. baccata]
MSGGPITQDWEPVVIRKKAPNAAAKKDEKAVNAARRSGAEIETLKKATAGTNKAASSSTTLNTRKLDDETENLAHERVPSELKKAIMQARTDKKLTQAQLAQIINEKPQVIQEYESGKAIPNQQVITKLERALGAKLRGPISQDWEPVVIRKKAPNAAAKKDEKAVNAARRSGAEIETLKKATAGTNKAASSSTTLNTRKLDEETENLAHDRVPSELKKAIMQARTDKKLTQAQLAQIINEKPQVIQEYESGKAIPNQQVITKLERALGAKLRGKNSHHINPLVVSNRAAPCDVDFTSTDDFADFIGGDGDVADPVRLPIPRLAGLGFEKQGFGDADLGGGVEEARDLVVGGVLEHDLVEEGVFAIAAGSAVLGVLVVVEGVVGGLAEVAAAEDEVSSDFEIDERAPSELKKAIMQARTGKKRTQAQLAQIINEKPQVIQEHESGKAIPNQQVITKLERALGAKLCRKNSHPINPLIVSNRAAPCDVDFTPTDGFADFIGGDSDVADPVRLPIPRLAGLGFEKQGFGDADLGSGVEEAKDLVVGGVLEHDLVEEGLFAIAAGSAVLGVLVVVEGVVGGLAEVAAAEDVGSEIEV